MKSGELYQDNIQNNKCCAICGVEHIAGEKLWMSVVELSTDDLIMNMLFVFCNSCVPFACKQPIVVEDDVDERGFKRYNPSGE